MLKKIGLAVLGVLLSVVAIWLSLVGVGEYNNKRIRPVN